MQTDLLGELLKERYGGDKPQDLHIDLFYLILGKEIVGRCDLPCRTIASTQACFCACTLQNKEDDCSVVLSCTDIVLMQNHFLFFITVIVKLNMVEQQNVDSEITRVP